MNEVIHNRTHVKLGWLDLIRVICGKTLHVDADIEIAQPEVTVIKYTSRAWVEEIFPRKRQGYSEVAGAASEGESNG